MTRTPDPRGEIRVVPWFRTTGWELRCPGCGAWGRIDDDQLHGRVSVDHSGDDAPVTVYAPEGCTFHETRDWFTTAVRLPAPS